MEAAAHRSSWWGQSSWARLDPLLVMWPEEGGIMSLLFVGPWHFGECQMSDRMTRWLPAWAWGLGHGFFLAARAGIGHIPVVIPEAPGG